MMKPGITVIVVDSVAEAVWYYAEKLAFDIAELTEDKENPENLVYAQVRKGKCHIFFRLPVADEQIEHSQIKGCRGRAVGIYVEMKKGIEKYFARCQKKGVNVVEEIVETPWGARCFAIKDPFGVTLKFAEPIPGFKPNLLDFAGLQLDMSKSENELIEEMCAHLRGFRISRRASKKYAKAWLKRITKGS